MVVVVVVVVASQSMDGSLEPRKGGRQVDVTPEKMALGYLVCLRIRVGLACHPRGESPSGLRDTGGSGSVSGSVSGSGSGSGDSVEICGVRENSGASRTGGREGWWGW